MIQINIKILKPLLMLLLVLLTITTALVIVSAYKRAPPYANARVDYLAYENAVADAKAEPGYGRAYLYSYISIPPGIGGADLATSEVEFNGDPVPGNSPVVSYLPYVYEESYFHLKGTVDLGDYSFGYIWIEIKTYVYKNGNWELYYSNEIHEVFYEGTYNEGHLLSGYVEISDTSVEKVTATPFVSTEVYGYCSENEVCPWIQGVADFYTNGYPYNYVYVPYIEVPTGA